MYKLGVIRHDFRRPAPQVPIEPVRHRLAFHAVFPGAGVIPVLHLGDLAQAAAADELAGLLVDRHRALLAADLKDALVLPHGLGHQAAFADGDRHRLLGIDILARLAGVDADQRPPVFGRGRDDGVDILAVEHFAIVLDGHAVVLLGGCLGAGKIDVGDGDESRAGILQRAGQVAAALPADADAGDADLVVGPRPPGCGQDAGRNEVRRGDTGRGQGGAMLEKLAS